MSGLGSGGGFRQAVGFLTVGGGPSDPTSSSLGWFPVVGAGIGALLGVCWWGLAHLFPPFVVAALVVALDLLITGMLHFDGLVDAADGLLPHLPVERRLAVMAEPQAGAFGVAVATTTLLCRFAALVALSELWPFQLSRVVLLLAAVYVLSRAVMVLAIDRLSYVRAGGIAAAFLGPRARGLVQGLAALASLGLGLGALLAWNIRGGGVVFVAELLAAGSVLGLARRRIGGY
ncbi:MAG: adenosylcobinamide-GDP ribazoletransferase, partial [Acidimicrobiales bacterium]